MFEWIKQHVKTTIAISTAIVIIGCGVALNCYIDSVYNDGYTAGIDYANTTIDKLNDDWNLRVKQIQYQYNKQLNDVNVKYHEELTAVNKQLDNLTNNPKIVTRYVTKTEYVIPQGFVLWHDRACQSIDLNDSIDIDTQAKSSYTLSDAATTIAANYTKCNLCISRLTALQDLVRSYIDKQNQLIEQKVE